MTFIFRIKRHLFFVRSFSRMVCGISTLLSMHAFSAEKSNLESFYDTLMQDQITTLEDAVKRLPRKYHKNYTLVFEGHGPQSASVYYPRVVMFGRNAQTVLTYAGQSTASGGQDLEAAEFNKETKKWEYRFIRFTPGKKPEISEKNPQFCLACHGDNPRPIVDSYPKTTGFYRGDHDRITHYLEQIHYYEFLEKNQKNDRYRYLKDFMKVERPNQRYRSFLSQWQAVRLTAELMKSKKFQKFYPLKLAADCGPVTPQSEVFQQRWKSVVKAELQKKYPNSNWSWNPESKMEYASDFYVAAFTNSSVFTSELKSSVQRNPYLGPTRDGTFFDGCYSLKDYLMSRWIEEWLMDHPGDEKYFSQTFDLDLIRTHYSWTVKGCEEFRKKLSR